MRPHGLLQMSLRCTAVLRESGRFSVVSRTLVLDLPPDLQAAVRNGAVIGITAAAERTGTIVDSCHCQRGTPLTNKQTNKQRGTPLTSPVRTSINSDRDETLEMRLSSARLPTACNMQHATCTRHYATCDAMWPRTSGALTGHRSIIAIGV